MDADSNERKIADEDAAETAGAPLTDPFAVAAQQIAAANTAAGGSAGGSAPGGAAPDAAAPDSTERKIADED